MDRIALAKSRILSVLDTYPVAHQRTLEQKISDQGPIHKRVDPHLITYAIKDMLALNRLAEHHSQEFPDVPWYSNIGTKHSKIAAPLSELSTLYNTVSTAYSQLLGDALEVATFQALRTTKEAKGRYHFDGYFYLGAPKNKFGRFSQRKAPTILGDNKTDRQPDFLQYGHDEGVLCIECKNVREWTYPRNNFIKHHILRCSELNAIPVFVIRRIHYSTRTNLLEPAGLIAHESYHQYFPSDTAEIANRAKHKESLGFTDIVASEEPQPRTVKFFLNDLPDLVPRMAARWAQNRTALVDYANGDIHLAQLYNAIGSRAGGKWVDEIADEAEAEDDWYQDEGGEED
ncbi:hypothetical protein ACFSQQ_20365 [Mesorhizobium kowhaii]|uniref:hypothetical protein n=1 Tax=Mesorhizobium kowhaii TaxID=1300272 RepID=UPI0035EC50CD